MTICKLMMRVLSGKTIPHPTLVSRLQGRNSRSLNLPCQPQNPSFSFLKDLGGEQLGRCVFMKFLSTLCTWRVPKESIWTNYFPLFFSPPFILLGIKLGHFRTIRLINIVFQVITNNSTEPHPKLLSR